MLSQLIKKFALLFALSIAIGAVTIFTLPESAEAQEAQPAAEQTKEITGTQTVTNTGVVTKQVQATAATRMALNAKMTADPDQSWEERVNMVVIRSSVVADGRIMAEDWLWLTVTDKTEKPWRTIEKLMGQLSISGTYSVLSYETDKPFAQVLCGEDKDQDGECDEAEKFTRYVLPDFPVNEATVDVTVSGVISYTFVK